MNIRTPLFAGCALLALGAVAPAFAQDEPINTAGAAAQDEENRVSEVTVTAERREQNLQEVPIAITAIDDQTRERVGINTIQDLTQFTPGLYYNTATDRPAIRGIGRQSNTPSLDSPVASYVDGVYTSTIQDAARRPIFIERNEILRGPQGALSGRGSIAGAINTITKQPSKTFGGAIGGLVGNYDRWALETTVTGPLNDWVQARLNLGIYRQNEGFFENAADNRTEGNNLLNRQIADLLITAQPTEKIDLFAKASTSDYKEKRRSGSTLAPYIAGSDPCNPSLGTGSSPSASFGLFEPGLGCGQIKIPVVGAPAGTFVPFDPQVVMLGSQKTNPNTPGDLRNYNTNFPATQQLITPYHNYTGHVTYHAPFADFKYLIANQGYTYLHRTDADDTPVQSYLIGTATFNPADPANPTIATRRISPGTINEYEEDKEWTSHEINVTSTGDGKLQWIFGLFRSEEDLGSTPQAIYAPGFTSALAQPGSYAFRPFGIQFNPNPNVGLPPPNPVDGRLTYGRLEGRTISQAVFGQLDYELTDRIKLTGGLRYNDDDKQYTEEARFLQLTSTVAGDTVVDNTFVFFRGYTVVNPATAVVPQGYTLIDGSEFPLAPGGTTRVLPDGSLIGATNSGVLFAPGVVGFPTMDLGTGVRRRHLANDWHALTGSFNVDYKWNDDTMVYARYARGYRPGGFNAGFINAVPQVEPEFVNSYEVGAKMTVSGTLRVNTAAFYYDYTDIQLPLPIFGRCTTPGDFSTCTSINSFINLPSATSKGFELEAIWYPTNDLQFLLSYGYVDARVKNGKTDTGFENGDDPSALFPTAQPYLPIQNCVRNAGVPSTEVCEIGVNGTAVPLLDSITGLPRFTQDLSGNPLVASPKHKVALNGNYTFRNFMGAGDLTVSASYIWRSKSYGDLFASEISVTPSYSQTNLRAIYETTDKKYQFIAYVQNVFDQTVAEFAGATRRSVAGPGTGQVFYKTYDLAPPRIFGVEVQRRF